jgi:phytoene synthase
MTPLEWIRIGLAVIASVSSLIIFWDMHQKRKDIKQCEAIIKKNSLTFYKAFSKIQDRKKREAIYAVYAFCRYADDLVDEDQDEKGLIALKDELDAYVKGEKPTSFRFRALKQTMHDVYPKNYDYKPFYDMIKGQEMDLNFKGYQTENELLNYCYHVAGTVGLMLIPILAGKNDKKLHQFAINLGYGMQITNILRDIGEDEKAGRIYIPEELISKANVRKEDLHHGKISIEFINMFEDLAKKAEKYFDDALEELHLFPKDVQLPLGLSIVLYRGILDACRENGYDVFSKKNFVSDEKKNELINAFLKRQK